MLVMSNISKVAALALALALGVCGCNRSSVKEAPITGRASDPAVTMTARWQEGKRYIFRVESVTSSQVPRKNTAQLIQTETSLAQDLAFSVTNVAPDGSRVLQMEILAVQMETGRDTGVTMSFDSGNKVMQVEDTPLIQRLRRFVGLKLQFRLSPENKVTRVDGVKELTDRQSGGNSSTRGVAAGVIARYFNQQFYRDLVEMGMLPKTPVRIGDTWAIDRPANAGASGNPFPAVFTYTFRGWQKRDGTNCARLDFTGEFKPAPSPTNGSIVGKIVRAAAARPNLEEGSITGHSWYSPEHTLAIETIYNQSITARTATGRRVRTKTTDTNGVEIIEMASDTNAPPPAPVSSNGPPPVVTTTTTTSHQSTSIKLLEVELLQP
jgi:hypothetical protein